MSLYIAFPDIPVNAVKVVAAQTYTDFQPHWNLFKGKRYHHGKIAASTAADRNLTFTLADGLPKSASYFILSRADLLLTQGMTAHNLLRSSDGISWTSAINAPLSTSNLVGIRNQDIIQTFPQTAAFQYWRSSIVCPNAVTRYSKLYFGNLFDIGTYPDSFSYDQTRPQRSDFEADSGARHQIQTSLPKYQFKIVWEGVSEAKCLEFANLLKPNLNGFFLYAPTQPQILAGNILAHVRCIFYRKDDTEGWPDWNRITCIFEEMIG